MPAEIVFTKLPSGVSSTTLGEQAYDWESIKLLAERGVKYSTISKHFKGLEICTISKRAQLDNWLTPARTKRMMRDVQKKQEFSLANTGATVDPDVVMAEIWKERQAQLDDVAFEIVEQALGAVTPERAFAMIAEAKDLKSIVETGRKVTGQDARDAEEVSNGPGMAVNIGFLRSAGIEEIEVLDV